MLTKIIERGSNGGDLQNWTMEYYDNGIGYQSPIDWTSQHKDNIKTGAFTSNNQASALGTTTSFGGGFRIYS